MAATIAYDQPVKDFIAGLDATGHVTHTQHRKTSITFHHNGGRLSLQGILDVWKTREASAHFQSDGEGNIGQYVRVAEYAWATGNTQGNKESISIELANATTAPAWLVAEKTWKSGARLGGWLFARVIGAAPTRETVHYHYDWKSTTCAGPYMKSIREQVFQEVLAAYNYFVDNPSAPSPAPAPTPAPAPSGKLSIDQVADQVIAGAWGSGDDRKRRLSQQGYDAAAVQRRVNEKLSGKKAAPAPSRKSNEQLADEVIAGVWGNNPGRGQKLAAAGYSPTAVQAAVNAKLGGGRGGATRLSVGELASQVIAGQWGNGNERRSRITSAGYDYEAVRAEVNRRL